MKLSSDAIASFGRLSVAGRVEACRLLCLSAARSGNTTEFQRGLKSLRSIPAEKWINSTISFLLGFNARLEGNLPEAEEHQRAAYDFRPGNFSAARELAFICLTRGKIEDAERFARSAFASAPDNPYILDILAGVLIQLVRKGRPGAGYELEEILERLQRSTNDDGSSFFETRRAEYELISGNTGEAAKLIDEASRKTPYIFNVQALKARVYLARHNPSAVSDAIRSMNKLVNRNSTSDGRTNLRPMLEIESEFYALEGDFDKAKKVYDIPGVFDAVERQLALKKTGTC